MTEGRDPMRRQGVVRWARAIGSGLLVALVVIRLLLLAGISGSFTQREAVESPSGGVLLSPEGRSAEEQGPTVAARGVEVDSQLPATPSLVPTRTATICPSHTPTTIPSPTAVRIMVDDEVWLDLGQQLVDADELVDAVFLVPVRDLSGSIEANAPALRWVWDAPPGSMVLRRESYYAAFHVTRPRASLTAADVAELLSRSGEPHLVCGDEGRLARSLVGGQALADGTVLKASWNEAEAYVATHEDAWALLPWQALDHRVHVAPVSEEATGVVDASGAGALNRALVLEHPQGLSQELVGALIAVVAQGEPAVAELVAVGDIMLDRYVGQMIAEHGPDYPFDGAGVRQMLSEADIAFGNLECPVSERGLREDKGYEFRASPDVVEGLANAGFDLLCLANNHTGDYGDEALLDTLDLISGAGIATVGAGRTITDAHTATHVVVNGLDVAFLAYNEILPRWFEATEDSPGSAFMDEDVMVKAVTAARCDADVVVVSCHWGVEYSAMPSSRQQRIGEALAEAGADLVIGHHPHVVQGLDYQEETLITYSLGNFVFDQGFSKATSQGAALWCLLDSSGIRVARLVPYEIVKGQPGLLSAGEDAAVTEHMLAVTAATGRFPREQ